MLTSQQARAIVERWRDKFPSADALMSSYDRYESRIPAPARSAESFERWLSEDADQQFVRAAVMSVLPVEAAAQPSTFDLDYVRMDGAIAAGDVHDYRNPLLSGEQHAAACVRCAFGAESRQWIDERDVAAGKRRFPGFATRLQPFVQRTTVRCPECGVMEDLPAPDTCQRSFWHLPDIWLALHPDATLEDLGTCGSFLRRFLRRQRPPATSA